MKYKLKDIDGRVNFLLKAGKDFVRNCMLTEYAEYLLANEKVSASNIDGYPIAVNNTMFFEGEIIGENKSSRKRKKL